MTLSFFKDRTHDLLPKGRAPYAVRAALAKAGGVTPYREPKYRMVRSDCVREWHGGRWIDWPDKATIQEQGGMVWSDRTVMRRYAIRTGDPKIPVQMIEVAEPEGLVASPVKPVRVVEEMRYVRKYPQIDGWILQRWYPAAHYLDRGWWEAQTWPGRADLMILGPYPEFGAYEVLSWFDRGPDGAIINIRAYEEIPGISRLQLAVEYCESSRLEDEMTPETRRLIRVREYEERTRAELERARDERSMLVKEQLKPYLTSSLASGRLRGVLAAKAGVTSHVGN